MTDDAADPLTNPYAAPQPSPPSAEGLLISGIDPETAIVAEGVVTQADFYAAQILHRSSRRLADILWLVILVLFSGGGIKLLLQGTNWGVVLFVLVFVLGNLILIRFVFPRIAARRVWQRAQSLRSHMRRLISPQLVQTITADSNVTVRWTAYVKYRASDQVMLLYLTDHPQLFTMFPRSMFRNDEDWRRFLQLVHERLPEG